MQIKNPKKEVPYGICLNDKDCLNNLLTILKDLVKNYTVALTEASNECLYRKYKKIFDEYMDLQREVFELAFKKGWYVLEEEDNKKINTAYDKLNKEYQELT